MGIQGLTSFIDDNGTFLKDDHFRNSKLVIDGSNLYHSLYFNSCLDQKHGGDYDAFEDQVCEFFKVLRDCDIDPYVIIDGGSDHTDNKFKTLHQRAQSKINTADDLSMGLQGGSIVPTLVKQVFKQVLSSLNVSFAQCICEADQEIVSLAQRWTCPVLSNDSDFYIFDIQAGYLPMSHFQWQKASVQRGSSQRSIPCKRYTTTSFCSQVNINRQLLPVFAVIAGNDYVNLRNMGVSIRWEDYSSMKPNRKPKFVFFDRLLDWLTRFQGQQEALDSVPRLIGHGNNRHKMAAALQALSLGIVEYQLPPDYLERFFNDDVAPDPDHLPEPLRVLPDWTLLPLTKGRLPTRMVDVLQLRKVIQGVQVEDLHLPSGNTTSRPIRQVLYGLLLGERREVEEYDREGKNLTSSKVKAILPSAAQHLQLATLDQAPQSVRLEVFLETLDRPLLQALLLGLVYGELCRQRKSQKGFIEEGPVLERLRGLIQRGARGLDLGVAHAYSQWQCCMRDGLDLNQLLCLPLPEPQCAWLYRGTLVHQLVAELRQGVNPESLLMEDPPSEQLYSAMLGATRSSQETEATGQPDGP
ncbi:hypothetical protein J4Q44_G00028230 [Coregonus suidteri]|uniref:XPG N-terminal domain-containing protein n=1 Tax=Coregonus suidteri TaxID=861788 RepID=A0AAN8MAB0_9TELE